MKHVGLAVVVLAFITSVVTQAQDADTQPSLELKLSRTLTLDPSGTAPAPDPVESAPSSVVPPTVGGDSVAWWGFLALAGLPLFFWLGRRQQQPAVAAAQQAEHSLEQQVAVLKDAVMEAGAGPRSEWQSTLTTLHSQLEEKSRYIDRLHDQNSSSSEQLDEYEIILQQQSETITQQLEDQILAADQILADQSGEFEEKLKAQTTQAQQQLDTVSQDNQQKIDQLTEQGKSVSSERDRIQTELESAETQLQDLQTAHASISEELEKNSADLNASNAKLGPASQRAEELSSEVAALKASNDERLEEIEQLTKARTALESKLEPTAKQIEELSTEVSTLKAVNDERAKEIEELTEAGIALEIKLEETNDNLVHEAKQTTSRLTQELEETRQENQRLLQQLEDQKRDAEARLASEQHSFSQALESEQRDYEKTEEQSAAQYNTRISVLEAAIQERDSKYKELEADFAFSSDSAQAALDDRDQDLAAMVAKLSSMTSTDEALEELKKVNADLVIELDAKTASHRETEEVLNESKAQIEQLKSAQHQLQLNDAELAQMQSIIVETEQALGDARNELKEQGKQLEQSAQAAEAHSREQATYSLELEQIRSQLAAVTERAEEESRRANHAVEERHAHEQTLQASIAQKDEEIALLKEATGTLEAEYSGQNNLINSLESSVLQLETDLAFRENENTETLKLLASATDQTAELEAKIESNDVLDSHIQELESQLVHEQIEHAETRLQPAETSANQMEMLEHQRVRAAELEVELDSLKLTLATQNQANDHLKKTLDQARKYREELEENTRDLERENRELSKTQTKTRQDLHVTNQTLQKNNEKLSEREQKVNEMKHKLDANASELKATKSQLDSMYAKVDKLTAAIAQAESDESGDGEASFLGKELEQTRTELERRTKELDEVAAARDEHQRNTTALQDQLMQTQKQVAEKTERAKTLGAQIVELCEKRDHNLNVIALLENQIDASGHTPAGKSIASNDLSEETRRLDHEEAMRARENIIAALEKELSKADITIAGLEQKLDDAEMAERAESRRDEPVSQPVKDEDYDRLKLALINKTRLVQSLSNEVKVNKDLVRVFENDSNMLHDTEVKLESQEDHNQFLEHELAKAVTENKTLKAEIEKAAKRLARHQNIGRTISEDTRMEQLRSRLTTLETENKEQLDMIAQLRDQQDATN